MFREQIRKYYLDLRKKNYEKLLVNKNQAILEQVVKYLILHPWLNKIAIYYSHNFEVDTINIIKYLLRKKYEVYLPKIVDDKNKIMKFVKINTIDFAYETKFNIKQPIDDKYIDPLLLDVIFVPLVSFDKRKNRLGYGYGYYDRFLKLTYAKKIGLAFQIQKHYHISNNEYDISLDLVITENGVN